MNLVLTPVHKNFAVLKQCCDALDKYSAMPFLHVLVDDNSGFEIPVEVTQRRRILYVKSDVIGYEHKNQLGQMLDLGYWYGTQMYWNEFRQFSDKVFIIESDVVVKHDWDTKMIEFANSLKNNTWLSLDCKSVDEDGNTTYPDTVAPIEGRKENLDYLEYPMFQCTLINLAVFGDIRFSDFPSHFDILWGRAAKKLFKNRSCIRNNDIHVLHLNGGGNSRQYL